MEAEGLRISIGDLSRHLPVPLLHHAHIVALSTSDRAGDSAADGDRVLRGFWCAADWGSRDKRRHSALKDGHSKPYPYKNRDSNECAGVCLGGNHRPGSSPGLYTEGIVSRKVRYVKTDFAPVTQRNSFGSY